MKIFAAGISTETNTFCPVLTGLADFNVLRGQDASERARLPALDLFKIWGIQAQEHGYELICGLNASAEPSGITIRAAYESLRDEMLKDLEAAMPVDVVLLMLHGAMVAEGYDDCEEDIIRRVREIAGRPRVIIGVEFDLHCHLSPEKIAHADIVITYKEYPHVDINDRARELFELATAASLGKVRPLMALFDCQMIGFYPTSRQPFRGFVNAMKEVERRENVLSVSFGHGFQFADVPHVGAKILVVTDNDHALAQQIARDLGLCVYALRREIGFESLSLPMDEALTKALESQRRPVVVADQSDNTGGGAPGDATFALRWLLDHEATDVALAIFYDPEVVKIAKRAGKGAKLSVRLGGKMGPFSGIPLDIDVTVVSVINNYMHGLSQESGESWLSSVGDVVALRCGSIDVVVGSERCQCFSPLVFTDLGIDTRSKRLLIPKSYQHFYEAFSSIAGEVIYMAAPGAVPPDPRQIRYHRVNTSVLYPWAEDPLAASLAVTGSRITTASIPELSVTQYELGPDSNRQPDVPQGKIMEFMLADSKIFAGFEHRWWLYIPVPCTRQEPVALMVFQDGEWFLKRDGQYRVPIVLDNLIAHKELPLMAAVFVEPGVSVGRDRNGKPLDNNRSVEYDTLSAAYATFLLKEIIPEVRKHVAITDDPEGRGIGGCSSGGICAFTVAWQRPDQFRKVLSLSGSYTNIRGGQVYPGLVRQARKKPVRVWQQSGANDMQVTGWGIWSEANKSMAAALDQKGYDHRFVFDQDVHCGKSGASLLPDAMRWLWRDYPKDAR